jgi:hypothetical protein
VPGSRLAPDRVKEWTEVLPGQIEVSQAGCLREVLEDKEYRNLEFQMFDAARLGAAAERHAGESKQKRRVSVLSDNPIPPEKALECRAAFEKAMAMLKDPLLRGDLPPISDDSLRMAYDLFGEYVKREQEIGNRRTLLELLHVVGFTSSEQLKLRTPDLACRYWFEQIVRSVAHDLLRVSESEENLIARGLELVDCPGSWLEKRLRLSVQRGDPKPEPSHHNDAARLSYLPYVDLLFTDRQMVGFTRQVMRDGKTPESIKGLRPPVAVPHTLEALEDKLESLTAA